MGGTPGAGGLRWSNREAFPVLYARLMGRRFWIAWALSGVAAAGAYLLLWEFNPALPYATGGEDYPRVGITSAVLGIPLLLSVVRVSKMRDPGTPARYLVPAFLGLGIFVVGSMAGFIPDALGCAGIARFGPLPSDCTTSSAVRGDILTEMAALWLLYGALSALVAALRSRRARRREG